MNSHGISHAAFAMDMKKICRQIKKGFTLVELLVVIAILAVVMTMAAGVLRDAGKGRGIESGVELLESMLLEARATAQGNDTYTRLIIIADPKDDSADTVHLRYMTVQIFRKGDGTNNFGLTRIEVFDGLADVLVDCEAEGHFVRVTAGDFLV